MPEYMKVGYLHFKNIFSFDLLILILLFLLFLLCTIFIEDKQQYKQQQNAMALEQDDDNNNNNKYNEALETFKNAFCGDNDAKPNSTDYITEYMLPQYCEMPLGIAVDDKENKVWYVSTKKGILGSYDIEQDKFDKEKIIPTWVGRESPRGYSQAWDVEIDNRKEQQEPRGGGEEEAGADVWFTDEQQNAVWRYIKSSETFEKYIIPGKSESFDTIYPISIKFDPNNKNIIYLVGTYSPSLWVIDITKIKNGTSDGISQIHLPIENGFKGIDPVYITVGSIAFDDKRDAIWISVLSYLTKKGQIFKYDLDSKSFDVYDLSEEEQGVNSPWGLVVDNDNDDLWITNAGTSIFYKFDPHEDNNNNNNDDNIDNNIVKFVTSKTSPRIFGGINAIDNGNISSIYKNSYTLPSWIKKSNDGSIWFNEQQGNKIAKFDPSDMKLIEYWVPTQNRLWGLCPDYYNNKNNSGMTNIISKQICVIANVIQYSIGKDHGDGNYQIWFTEWSQNKIGKLEADDKNLPFSISISESDKKLTITRGETEKIKIRVKASESSSSSSSSSSFSSDNIHMIASGTFTTTGDLGNSTGYFSQESLSIDKGEQQVSFEFTPSIDLKPGDYTLMLGAENDSVSYLQAVKIKIT
jgi:virginiamycin B lyase